MALIDLARGHLKTITTNDAIGFSQDVTFTTPDGLTTVTVKALHTTHWNNFDAEGFKVSAKNSSVAVSEKVLNDLGYVTRNASGLVFMEGHRVTAADSTGSNRTYIVSDRKPDSELGLLVLMLTDFSE